MNEAFQKIQETYINQIDDDFESAIAYLKETFDADYVIQLIGGYLARQTNLAHQIASNPFICNAESGCLLLRCMLEIEIKVAWVMKSPKERSKQMICQDLIALRDLHNRATEFSTKNKIDLDAQGVDPSVLELWLEEQDVIHKFSNIKEKRLDPRNMALDAGEATMRRYRSFYIQLSSSLHSTWNHISRYNLVRNPNPLHRGHFIPTIRRPRSTIQVWVMAADFLDKTMNTLLPESRRSEAFASLTSALEALSDGSSSSQPTSPAGE